MGIPGFDAGTALGKPLHQYRGGTTNGALASAAGHEVVAAQGSDFDDDDSCYDGCESDCMADGGEPSDCEDECSDAGSAAVVTYARDTRLMAADCAASSRANRVSELFDWQALRPDHRCCLTFTKRLRRRIR